LRFGVPSVHEFYVSTYASGVYIYLDSAHGRNILDVNTF